MAPFSPANGTPDEHTNGDGYYESGPFAEERPGWAGYIEWERYPEKKAMAAKILAAHQFPPVTSPTKSPLDWKAWI